MKLHCADCGKYMGEVRDAQPAKRHGGSVRAVQQAPCNKKRTKPLEVPDFLRGLMGGRK